MKRVLFLAMIVSFTAAIASAQSNRIVFGPLEGDDAGILTVLNGEDIEIEMWVRSDPDNPAPIMGVSHALMSEDEIIAERNGAQLDPDYDMPSWELVEVDGPFVHDPGSTYPIPVGNTCEIQYAILAVFEPPVGDPLDTQGEWDYYGAFLMTCNTNVPTDNTYYPFSAGWYPHSGEGFRWAFEAPPGGAVVPEQDYGGLHFAPISNRIVFGPLEGEDAGVLTVHNGEDIEIEMWIRTDPDNPAPVVAVGHALMSEDEIIAERNGAQIDPQYDMPNWEHVFVDGPYVHNPGSNYPIPVGNTCEIQGALWVVLDPPVGDPLDTQGEWDYYGAFLMTCNTDVPIDNTYYPFSAGWYPHNGFGFRWSFDGGGSVDPEQSYGGLHFAPISNRIVFGPLEGEDAGVLTVHNGEDIEIEMWVRTDPSNSAPVIALQHGLLSEDAIISERNGVALDPRFDEPNWEDVWLDGPFHHDPNWDYPIPEGHTCEMQGAIWEVFSPPPGDPLDTQGEWDYYGAFLMTCNTDVPIDNIYYPFQMGWYPHSGEETKWLAGWPPYDEYIIPEQGYGGLYFEPAPCEYIPGDCDHNGTALELNDLIAMIGMYRGMVIPYYTCDCPPHGSDFAPEGDTDGNCVAFELGDVVTEIGAYRGTATPQGCVDCPGSW